MLLRVFLAGAWLALLVTPAAAQVRGGLPEWDGTPDPVALRALEEGRRDEVDRALRGRQWERAARLLVTEIERGPASPELLKLLAGVFMRDRKPLNAAIAIKKAEALGPLDHGTRFQLALAFIAMHRGDWARPELQQLAVRRCRLRPPPSGLAFVPVARRADDSSPARSPRSLRA